MGATSGGGFFFGGGQAREAALKEELPSWKVGRAEEEC